MLQRKVRCSSTSDAAEPTSTILSTSSSASLVSVISEDRLPSLASWANDACDDVTLASVPPTSSTPRNDHSSSTTTSPDDSQGDPSTFAHPWSSPPLWTPDSTPSDSVIPRVKRKQGRIEGAIVAPDGHHPSTATSARYCSRHDDDDDHRQYPYPPHHDDRWLRSPRHQHWSSSSSYSYSSSTSSASSAAKTCCRGLQRLFSAYALAAIAVWCSLLASICECQAAPPNYSVYKMPDTDFDCRNKVVGGYYADPQAFCQMFHVCVQVGQSEVRDFRFLCPNDTVFDQKNFICANWWEVECGPANATSSSSSSERPSPGSSSAAPSSSSSSSSTASFVSSTTPFPSSLPPNAAVGIVNKGTPVRGSTAAPEAKPAPQEKPTDSSKSDNQQQTEYDYLYYEDVPPEYEYEYVDANGNVYPAPNPQQQQQQQQDEQQQQPQKQDQGNKRPPQVQSSTTRPQPPARNHQQQGGDHFSGNRDSSLGLSHADEGEFFPPANNEQQRRPSEGSQSSSFFFSGPSSKPFPPAHQRPQGQPPPGARPSPNLSTKGDAGNQQQHQQLRRPLPPSRPEAVEDFISTKVQQPSKESVAFVSSGKLSGASGGDSASGFFAVREHHHASKDRQKQLHPSSVSSHSQQRLSSGGSNRFFDDLPPLGDDPSALGPPPPHKARPAKSSKKPGPQIHTYSEVNRPKSSYFVSTQLSAPTDGNNNGAGGDRHRHNQHQHHHHHQHHQPRRNSRKNDDDSSTDGTDGGAVEQDQGEKVDKVETEVKDRYHHIVHHRDGDEGFRYHYQETPVRKVTLESDAESLDGNPEPSAPATDRAAIIDTEPPVDLLGRSSSLTAPSNIEHHDTSGGSDGHGSPHHSSAPEQHLPDLFSVPGEAIAADSSTFPELHRAVSVSKTETQGPLLKLSSSSRRSTAKNVKVVGSDNNDSRAPFQSPGAADAGEVSVIVSRTSSSSSPSSASVRAGSSASPSALPLIATSPGAGVSHHQPRISRSHQETETASSSSATAGQANSAVVVVDHPLPTSAAAASIPNSDSNVDGDAAAEKDDARPRPDLLPVEEDWKRAERRQHHHRQDGDFGAKTIVSVRKSQSSRGGGPVAVNSSKLSSQRRR